MILSLKKCVLFRNYGHGQNYVPVQAAFSSESPTISLPSINFTSPFLMHR